MADNKVNSGLLEFSEDQKVFVALDAETSEVKKAVTIDGDGVETDIGGGGGGVTVESLSVTENGTYSEEGKAYSPVTVNVAGGESDFSTANITVELNLTGEWGGTLKSVAVIDNIITIRQNELKAGVAITTNNDNSTFPIVVYKNTPVSALLEPGIDFEITNATLTGEGNSAVYDDGGADLTIVTDGVLTITAVLNE